MRFLFFLLFANFSLVAISQIKRENRGRTILRDTSVRSKSIDSPRIHIDYTYSFNKTGSGDSQLIVKLDKTEASDSLKYIFPIITLLLGIFINKGLEWITDRKRLERVGKRWFAEISEFGLGIQKQIEYLTNFLADHVKEIFTVPELQIVSYLDGEIFKSLDKSDLVKYIETYKSKDFDKAVLAANKVSGFVNIASDHQHNLKIKFDEYLNSVSELTRSFSNNLQAVLVSFGNYQVEIENLIGAQNNVFEHAEFKQFNELFEKSIFPYMKSGAYDIFVLENDFFGPLIILLAFLRHDPKLKEMNESVKNCMSDIKRIKMERTYLSENINNLIGRYRESLKDLPKVLSEIKSA